MMFMGAVGGRLDVKLGPHIKFPSVCIIISFS